MPWRSARPERGLIWHSKPSGTAMLKPVRNSRRSNGARSPSSALARSYPAEPAVAGLGRGSPSAWGKRVIRTSTAGPHPFRSDNGVDVCQREAEGLRNSGIDHFPFDDVQAEPQRGVRLARRTPTLLGGLKSVRERSIGKSKGGRSRHTARHICHGVMQNAVYEVGRILVGGGLNRLDATTLVYRHVHNDGSWLHQLQVTSLDQV